MFKLETLIPQGYNIAPGAAGPHVAELKSGHARKRLHNQINNLISHGFTRAHIAFYVGLSQQSLDIEIHKGHEGKGFEIVQEELVNKRLFTLIDEGYFSLTEISQFFKGFKAKDVFFFLKEIDKGNEYLKGLIASAVAILNSERVSITNRLIAKKLGIEGSWVSLNRFIVAEMGGTSNLIRNYKFFLKYIAVEMIKFSDNSLDLLTKLGWLKGVIDPESNIIKDKNISNEIERRIQFLFNTDFAKAKKVHISGFIGKS